MGCNVVDVVWVGEYWVYNCCVVYWWVVVFKDCFGKGCFDCGKDYFVYVVVSKGES